MRALCSLLQHVLADASQWCCASTSRDLETITRRFEHEGLSFLTITLPSFSADFERSLSLGMIAPRLFLPFKKGRGGHLPSFLGGLTELVFDRSSGRLLDLPSHEAIFYIRQITLLCKKILIPCSTERVQDAYAKYIQCEKEVDRWCSTVPESLLRDFGSVCDLLWGSDLSLIDRMVYEGDLIPRHGPGATADRLVGNGKFRQSTWTTRLERYFPVGDYLIPNYGFYDDLQSIDFLEPEAEIPVRVITVPKTLKTPRIIAIEPTCMQYAQQALMEVIVDRLERSDTLKGAIGFTDQIPNQDLARLGSSSGGFATIDLSEASDRVSNLLVERMLLNFPSLAGAVQACRSARADVPGYGIIPLTKFASMGSALCFPIEAMVFLTIVTLGYQRVLNRHLTHQDIESLMSCVRVYGDDIIVPIDIARPVMHELSSFGMKVNENKTFWTGKFRESCGKDYYDGTDVSVTYVRRLIPSSLGNASEVASVVSLRNQLYKAGLWNTVRFLDDLIGRLAPFPIVEDTSPVLGRHSYLGPKKGQRFCDKLHIPLVKGLKLRPVPRKSKLDGPGALLKFFLKRGLQPIFDPKHLERYGRPKSVDIKIGWGSVT